jgi:hypothetical protein
LKHNLWKIDSQILPFQQQEDIMTTSSQEHHVENDKSAPETQIKLNVFPVSFRNEQFEENLAYFKTAQPAIYNTVVKHCCKEFRLCSNPDGSPNIIETKNNTAVYNTFDKTSFWDLINKNITNISADFTIPLHFIGGGDSRWKSNNPIQYGMLNSLYEKGVFHQLGVRDDNLEPFKNCSSDFLPFIRVYGVGLGYHITELIRLKNINYMSIYEPKLDLFYTSLFTIPWKLVFQYFDARGKGLNLVLGGAPDNAIRTNATFLKQRFMPLTTCFYRLKHLGSAEASELIKKEPQSDAVEREQSDAGWYEDQRFGFYLSARNIKNDSKFFSGRKIKQYFRAFIVGAGPSLNDTIHYIKAHQDDAVIVSCGSAITPLLKAGIIPDYEVVQERVWQFEKHEEKHDLELLKKVTLLKLNVVSQRIDKFYDDTLIFQKFRDPGSSMLADYPVTTAVNPTVTNAGISMCAALGVDEAYLFGVDYGAPKDSEKMHADNTIYDRATVDDSVKAKTRFDLPGNLGAPIRTDSTLSWSHQTTEMKIAEYPTIKWINVGEGALIAGASPLAPEKLPKKFKKKTAKKEVKKELSSCFNNNYSSAAVLQRLRTTQMLQINEYLEAISGFADSTPQTREEIIYILSLLYKAVNTGKEKSSYLPAALLPYGFIQFITSVYMQISLAENDRIAVSFFNDAMSILVDYITNIHQDLYRILELIPLEEETDLIETW